MVRLSLWAFEGPRTVKKSKNVDATEEKLALQLLLNAKAQRSNIYSVLTISPSLAQHINTSIPKSNPLPQ